MQFHILDKARLAGCCSMIKDHDGMGFKRHGGFQAMVNAQEHCGFQVFTIDFK